MKTIAERLAIAAALMLMAGQGFAQTSTGPTSAGHAATMDTRSMFAALSPNNQKIAHALFIAQQPTDDGPAPLDLNQIAALKGKKGWGDVFKRMKSEGLISARTLAQVVNAQTHSPQGRDGVGRHGLTAAGGHPSSAGSHRDADGGLDHGGSTAPGPGGGMDVATAGGNAHGR